MHALAIVALSLKVVPRALRAVQGFLTPTPSVAHRSHFFSSVVAQGAGATSGTRQRPAREPFFASQSKVFHHVSKAWKPSPRRFPRFGKNAALGFQCLESKGRRWKNRDINIQRFYQFSRTRQEKRRLGLAFAAGSLRRLYGFGSARLHADGLSTNTARARFRSARLVRASAFLCVAVAALASEVRRSLQGLAGSRISRVSSGGAPRRKGGPQVPAPREM